ncbi:MAG TPA: AraC family transcriptional regulator ligand-binding domain-containing protein [Polyangiaceae bacterium]|nr:AraC family transcriptional regulator ligand-binding domain-containing protein [Polyangiaceae bacterium]
MTDDAKRSTFAASGTMLAAVVQGNLHAAQAFGLDAEGLRKAAGLSDEMLSDPDGRIPVERYVALWEAIHAEPRALSFGLWLGKSLNVGALGVVGYVMQHAQDIRAALYCLERFNGLLGDGVGPQISERGEHVVLHRVEPPRLARIPSLSIAAPLGTVTLVRELAGLAPAEPLAIEAGFQHPAPPEEALAELAASLACPLRFNEGETRLVLPRSILERAVIAPNVGLSAYLERHAEALQARVRSSVSLAGQVREMLTARLREGEPEQGAVAQALALSERTLQRRLQEEGVTFAELMDEVRADLSRMYLADPKLAVFEVAFLLGYSEPSAFNRAFKRWTGQSPSEFRRST